MTGRAAMPAAGLSHGERRQLEVAVALASQPSVLLLDEPTAGMAAPETRRFMELVDALPSHADRRARGARPRGGLRSGHPPERAAPRPAPGRRRARRTVRADPAVRAAYLDARSLAS